MFENFTVWPDFEFWIRTGLNHREIYDCKSGDVASLAEVTVAWLSGRHNSPPLQEISSRDLRGSERGEGLVTNLAVLLILACTSGRGWPNTLMSSFLCFGHHDEVGVLSSGTPSYLRKNKGWAFWENGPRQGCLSGRQHRGRWRKVTLESKLKKISRAK